MHTHTYAAQVERALGTAAEELTAAGNPGAAFAHAIVRAIPQAPSSRLPSCVRPATTMSRVAAPARRRWFRFRCGSRRVARLRCVPGADRHQRFDAKVRHCRAFCVSGMKWRARSNRG